MARRTVEIDEELLQDVMGAFGTRTVSDTVNRALSEAKGVAMARAFARQQARQGGFVRYEPARRPRWFRR